MRLSYAVVAVLWASASTARSADTAAPQTLDGLSQCAVSIVINM
jgi:hypothetical protein